MDVHPAEMIFYPDVNSRISKDLWDVPRSQLPILWSFSFYSSPNLFFHLIILPGYQSPPSSPLGLCSPSPTKVSPVLSMPWGFAELSPRISYPTQEKSHQPLSLPTSWAVVKTPRWTVPQQRVFANFTRYRCGGEIALLAHSQECGSLKTSPFSLNSLSHRTLLSEDDVSSSSWRK